MNLDKEIDDFRYYINKVIFWRNDGSLYKGIIRGFNITKEAAKIEVERVVYKTVHYFDIKDYNNVWSFKIDGIKKKDFNLFNYEQ